MIKPATKLLDGTLPLCDEHAETHATEPDALSPVTEPADCFSCALLDDVTTEFVAKLREDLGEERFAMLVASIQVEDAIAKGTIFPFSDREDGEPPRILGPDEFRCAMCREVFYKGRPDGEAAAEHEERFPTISLDDCDLVCDDCFRKLSADTGIRLTQTKVPR